MKQQRGDMGPREMVPRDPSLPRKLLGDVRFAPLWLVLRVVLGWIWLEAGWRHMRETPWPGGQPAVSATGVGDLRAIGLTLAGIALILGIVTGAAAFAGGVLSVDWWAGGNVALAASSFAAAVYLVLTWKTAGWIGLDRWLLPLLGIPGRGGALLGSRTEHERGRGSRRLPWNARRLS